MKIGVIGFKNKVKNTNAVAALSALLREKGYETVIFSTPAEIENVDAVIVLGGDGAILHSAIKAAKNNIKIIGINYGNLGFLTEYEKDERERVKDLIEALEKGLCQIVKRSLLEITIGEKVFYALNEIAIQRDNSLISAAATQILAVEVEAQEGKDVIAGDGLLFCTPTGSTAYSLSAGGPVVEPVAQTMVVTPICTHNMRFSSYVLSPEHTLTVELERNGRKPVYLFVDESRAFALRSDDKIVVRRSKYVTTLVRLTERSFCEIFAQKMLPGGWNHEK